MVAAGGRRGPERAFCQTRGDAALVPAGSRPRAPGAHSLDAAFVAAPCYNDFWFFLDYSVNLRGNADLFVAFCVLRWAADFAFLRLSVTSPHPNFDYTKISISAKVYWMYANSASAQSPYFR